MSTTGDMLKNKKWAVVGASTDKTKFGYKIFKKLMDHGYEVYPVNPGYAEIDGIACYRSLRDIPQKPDVVDMVVNPRIGEAVINEAIELGINNIWFQPGTFKEEMANVLKENSINYVKDCILVALKNKQ